jgi:hypothetical protein
MGNIWQIVWQYIWQNYLITIWQQYLADAIVPFDRWVYVWDDSKRMSIQQGSPDQPIRSSWANTLWGTLS